MIRLLVIGLVGYLAYEFVQGLAHGSARREPRDEDVNEGRQPGVGAMTGPGRGKRVQTEDPDGASVPHVVGRGVVS